MKHILLRARKDAFEIVSPEDSLVRNTIADNAGNLIFSMAAQRILETASTRVTVDRFAIEPGDADRINERYDAYVIPLANAFRPSYEPILHRLTALIRRLRIPVVVLGVGAQGDVRYRTERLRPIEPAVRAFVGAVLDRSPSIGVRGELTLDYLTGLGFRDVEVIGCPSLFLHGDDLRVTKRRPTLDRDAHLAINVSPYVTAMGPIVMRHVARYPNLTYIAQDIDTLELLLWGGIGEDVDAAEPRGGGGGGGGPAPAPPPPPPAAHPRRPSPLPGRQGPLLRGPVAVARLPARRRLLVRDPHPRQHRRPHGRHAGRGPRPRLADAGAGALLRDPASPHR
jgi:hypothetical protein